MTIDERLQALTESVELIHLNQQAADERIKQLASATTDKIRHLAIIAEQNEVRAGNMMEAITRLARIADIHENRIHKLEG